MLSPSYTSPAGGCSQGQCEGCFCNRTGLSSTFLDEERTAVSEKSYDGASGPNLPITVLKWKPRLHSHFDGCLGESAVIEG